MSDLLDELVAIIAVSLTLGSPLLMVALVLRYKAIKQRSRQEVALRMLEQGHLPSADWLESKGSDWNDFRWGIVLSALGLALFAASAVLKDRDYLAGGFIPLLIGAGFLVTFYTRQRSLGPLDGKTGMD